MRKISCVMITAHRPQFVPKAIACFEAQTYPNRELVIFDNGDIPVEHLVPNDSRIRYYKKRRNAPDWTIADLRNIANDLTDGPLIAHWDDDDWSAPDRLALTAELLAGDVDVAGFSSMYFVDLRQREPIVWSYTAGVGNYAVGASLLYPKDLWRARPFHEDRDVREDTSFLYDRKVATMGALEPMLMVARTHRDCFSIRVSAGPQWEAILDPELAQAVRAVL